VNVRRPPLLVRTREAKGVGLIKTQLYGNVIVSQIYWKSRLLFYRNGFTICRKDPFPVLGEYGLDHVNHGTHTLFYHITTSVYSPFDGASIVILLVYV